MNNTECAVAVIARHREARTWTDVAVAANLLAELGLDPNGNAAHATANVDSRRVTEDQVAAAEGVAKQHVDTAAALRAKLDEQEAPARAETQRAAAAETGRVEAERVEAHRVAEQAEHAEEHEADTARKDAM